MKLFLTFIALLSAMAIGYRAGKQVIIIQNEPLVKVVERQQGAYYRSSLYFVMAAHDRGQDKELAEALSFWSTTHLK